MNIRSLKIVSGAAAAVTILIASGNAAIAEGGPKVDRSQPTPVIYPMEAQRLGEEGTVALRVMVSTSGAPINATIVGSSGHEDLDQAAVETVMNWHFVPGDTTNKAVVSVVYKVPQSAQK